MRNQLNELKDEITKDLEAALTLNDIEAVKVRYIGKKGLLTNILRGMGNLSAEERPIIGQLANDVRIFIEEKLDIKKKQIEKELIIKRINDEKIDISMPGRKRRLGTKHPLSIVLDDMKQVFIGMGYEIAEGPEVEYDRYNFELLNMPKEHPARDTQDTFYFTDNILLRTQTSSVQIRIMEGKKPPIRIICPGRVYRADEIDATHSPIFHQVEGLVVDEGVTFGDLIGTLQMFARNLFGENVKIRLRPHHFPYTEPSAEVDVTCWVCGGKGCRVCKQEGFIEILGAGMVHPVVLENCGIDSEKYSGFAFGIGVERTALGRYNIDDMRMLYENDVRFLKQF